MNLPAAGKRREAMKTLKSATDNRIAKTVGADKPPASLGHVRFRALISLAILAQVSRFRNPVHAS